MKSGGRRNYYENHNHNLSQLRSAEVLLGMPKSLYIVREDFLLLKQIFFSLNFTLSQQPTNTQTKFHNLTYFLVNNS